MNPGMNFNIKSQLPAGVKLLCNRQGWFNGKNGDKHMANICQSDDPRTVRNQVLADHAVGVSDEVMDWYGPEATDFAKPTDRATKIMADFCSTLNMGISIMIDSGAFKYSRTDFAKLLATDIIYIRQQYINRPNYTHIAGKPVIWEFGWAEHGINIGAVAAANPDLTILTQSRMAGGAGTYGWVNGMWNPITGAYPPNGAQTYVRNYLAQKDPIQIPCLFDGFDDSNPADPEHSRWDSKAPARKIPYGQWQMCLDEINKAAAAGKKFEAVMIGTGNDWDEKTQEESKFLALAGLKLY